LCRRLGDAYLGDAPHQLFDERGADALGPLRGLAHDGIAERQACLCRKFNRAGS
jgi:hypothetical protein